MLSKAEFMWLKRPVLRFAAALFFLLSKIDKHEMVNYSNVNRGYNN